jgi:hypothetical protein
MLKYNFRDVDHDKLQRALDKLAKAERRLVAMKTQGGAANFPQKMAQLMEKGFKKEVAAIKTSGWTAGCTSSSARWSIGATSARTSRRAGTRSAPRRRACWRSTGRRRPTCTATAAATSARPRPRGSPSPPCLRYLRYYAVYGKRQEAARPVSGLPPIAREVASANLLAAEAACPHARSGPT